MQRFRKNEACSFTRGLYLELTRFQLKNKILAKNISFHGKRGKGSILEEREMAAKDFGK